MNHSYARKNLKLLLRDLPNYTADEFRRQMARITTGTTGQEIPDDCHTIKAERDALKSNLDKIKRKVFEVYNAQLNVSFDNKAGVYEVFQLLGDCFEVAKETPQQCLRDIQADAIDNATTYLADSIPDKSYESVIFKDRYVYISTRYLREYAAKLRQGGEW